MAKILLLTLLVASDASELILDGGDEGWSQWYRSVDGVMGGRSSITVQRDGDVLEASGEIVTAGGGFAGMYTRLDDVDASNFAGLRVTFEALPAGHGSTRTMRRTTASVNSTKLVLLMQRRPRRKGRARRRTPRTTGAATSMKR